MRLARPTLLSLVVSWALFSAGCGGLSNSVVEIEALSRQLDAAAALYDEKKCAEAIEAFTKIIDSPSFTPSWVESNSTYIFRGNCYKVLEDFPKAIEDYSKAIEISPTWDYPYRLRSECWAALGKSEMADKDIEKAELYTDN